MNYAESLAKIAGFAHLNNKGWDSYDAGPVTQHAIDTAIGLLDNILLIAGLAQRLPDAIVPTCGGGVQFEWDDLLFGLEAELDVSAKGRLELTLFSPDLSKEWTIGLDHLKLKEGNADDN